MLQNVLFYYPFTLLDPYASRTDRDITGMIVSSANVPLN